jgi:hypothetical protein
MVGWSKVSFEPRKHCVQCGVEFDGVQFVVLGKVVRGDWWYCSGRCQAWYCKTHAMVLGDHPTQGWLRAFMDKRACPYCGDPVIRYVEDHPRVF